MDITLTLKCNNQCIFCPRKSYLRLIACHSLRQIYKDIEQTRRVSNSLALSGGEVTLLKEEKLRNIIDFCKKKKFNKIGIITNGRKLADPIFAENLICAGITDFAISIYSSNNKTHDRITRINGSCEETKRAIHNILALSFRYDIALRINLVLNNWNYKDIFQTLRHFHAKGIRNFIIAEQIIIDRNTMYLSYKKVKEFLSNIKKIYLNDTRLCLRGFPVCFLGRHFFYRKNRIILKNDNPVIVLERYELDTLVKDANKKNAYLDKFKKLFMKTENCNICFFQNQCLGFQKAYYGIC